MGLPYFPVLPVGHVSDDLRPRTISDGLDRQRRGRALPRPGTTVAKRHTQSHAAGRHSARHRRRHRVPAQYPHSVYVHLLYGDNGLYGARGLYHGQAHAHDRPARQVVHPAYHRLWLQRAGRDGDPHDREPQRPPDYDADCAVYVVQRAASDIYTSRGRVFPRPCGQRHFPDLPCRHRRVDSLGPVVPQDAVAVGREPVRHGDSALPLAQPQIALVRPVDEDQSLSQEDGRHYPRGLARHLGLGLFPALGRRPPRRHHGLLPRHHRAVHRAGPATVGL